MSYMKRNKIVIITTGWFPEGDAGAVRLQMMGRALTEIGYKVTVLCRGKLNDKGQYFSVEYCSYRNKQSGLFSKIFDFIEFPSKVKKYLNNNNEELYAVYIYNAHDSLFTYCKSFCHKHSIKLIHDCVEWYSPEEYTLGKFDIWYRKKNRINTKIIDKSFSIIAITKYLEEYFLSKGINTIRVPILCDTEIGITPKPLNENDVTTIFYGGLPGTKDLVGNLLEASLMLTEDEKKKLKIIIVGATKDYLVRVSHIRSDVIDRCLDYTVLHGRLQRKQVLEIMSKSDFSFLARDRELRYAKAGFPSKVVEALSNATPMICNITSDLADYLIDGNNAIIAASHAPADLCDAIRRAMSLSASEKQQMSSEALQTAKQYFDYRNYINELKQFLEG